MFKTLDQCLFCSSEGLTTYLDLGHQPPANSYSDKPNEQIQKFPLQVMLCNECGNSQLSVVVNPDILFERYLYVSGTTKTLEYHFKEFARECTENYTAGTVLEIGCNDGSCLKQFKENGWDVLGIDPALNLLPYSKANKVNVLPLYWDNGISKKLSGKTFNLIYGTNVFAHNLDPYSFLNECLNVLSEDGVIIIEVPYSFNMFKIIDVGQIYHEHINYLSCFSMIQLCNRLNIGVVDILETEVHGGSIRFYLKKDAEHSMDATRLAQYEVATGLFNMDFYRKFASGVMLNVIDLYNCINVLKTRYKVIGYGAAAKASTIINAMPGKLSLDYIVDDNPLKVWKYMPSTAIRILPTETLINEEDNLAIWITAHNFQKEIIERIKLHREGKNDIIISYVPEVKTELLA